MHKKGKPFKCKCGLENFRSYDTFKRHRAKCAFRDLTIKVEKPEEEAGEAEGEKPEAAKEAEVGEILIGQIYEK